MDMYGLLLARQLGAGGGGGTTNYNDLSNKPKINGVELQGNKSFSDLGLGTAAEKDYTDTVTDGSTDLPTCNAVHDFVQPQIDALRLMMNATVYGFRIDKTNSDPETRVEYLYDAVGMTPARMNYTTGQFDYGSWANAWFITGNKPCALKYDGTIDYYLDPDDYTKKADGTASDVSDSSYAGNFMASMPVVWIKRWEDTRYQYIAIANKQIDDDFKAYAHDAGDGFINDYIYLPMFKGSTIDGKIRSIAGQTPNGGAGWGANNTAVELNGAGWQMWDLSKHCLIVDLLTLISKTTNSQSAFGGGDGTTYDAEASDYGKLATGSNDLTTGQFWGVDDEAHHVKVFHIEDFWGNRSDMCWGLIGVDLFVYIKPTRPYNTTPDSSYIDTGVVLPLTTTAFIKDMYVSTEGVFPKMGGASNSTYMCDYMRTYTGTVLSVFGGNCGDGDGKIGYSCMHAHTGLNYEAWWRGSSVCYNATHSA